MFDLQVTRNAEAFARLVDMGHLRFGRWHRCAVPGLWLSLDVMSEAGSAERLRLTVAAAMPAPRLMQALVAATAGGSPRRFGGVPVRFFLASDCLMAAALMPPHTTARQWLPVYSAICRSLTGHIRERR